MWAQPISARAVKRITSLSNERPSLRSEPRSFQQEEAAQAGSYRSAPVSSALPVTRPGPRTRALAAHAESARAHRCWVRWQEAEVQKHKQSDGEGTETAPVLELVRFRSIRVPDKNDVYYKTPKKKPLPVEFYPEKWV